MSSNLSFAELIREQNLTAVRLFSFKNIVTDIKNNIQTFVSYALRHREFILQSLEIALESSVSQLQAKHQQNIAFNICEVLCCDQPAIAQLFFEPSSTNERRNSEISENIETEEQETIQSEAQRLFCDDEDDIDVIKELQSSPIQVSKDQIAKKSLQILKSLKNESSLGYLYKIWSFLIRNNANQVIEFFNNNREYYQLLMNNIRYPSIGNLVAQIIVSEDRTKEYKYESFKKQIISSVVQKLLEHKQDSELYEGIGIFLEEVFNSSKQSYCEYFEDFKRQVNYLFSSEVIEKFSLVLFEKDQKSIENVLKYFELLLNRVNSQKEDNENRHEEQTQSQVEFEIQTLNKYFPKLIKIIDEISGFGTIVKINFVNFLLQIMQTPQFQSQKGQIQFIKIFQELINVFKNQKSKGLYKQKLSKLIQCIIKMCQKEELQEYVNKDSEFYSKFYPSIQSINVENSKVYNKNQLVAFQCQILFQIQNKIPGSVETSSKLNQKNLKRIHKKYETKIANFGRANQTFSLEETGSFTFSEIPSLRLPEGFKMNNLNLEKKSGQSSRRSYVEQKKQIVVEKPIQAEIEDPISVEVQRSSQQQPSNAIDQLNQSKEGTDVKEQASTIEKKPEEQALDKVQQKQQKIIQIPKQQLVTFYVRHNALLLN